MVKHKLTDAKIKGIKKPGMYGDGAGLFLRLHASGSKSWFFVYTRNKVRRELGLGGFDGTAPVTLAAARRKADDLRELLSEGKDPYAERAVKRSRHATFSEVAERYIATRDDLSAHSVVEWKRQLLTNCSKIGNVAIESVNTDLIESVLRPLWETKPATGQRVRSKVEAVIDFATAKHLRSGDNPARWGGHLEHVLTSASRVTGANHAAMAFYDVPKFYSELGDEVVERCAKLVILTAVRSGEAREADWSEFDLKAATWAIPEGRTKTGKAHNVALSQQAIALLEAIGPKGNGFVFEGTKPNRPFGNAALPLMMNEKRPGLTMHGFRSAFKDWSTETTEYPAIVSEMALGHQVGSAVERAYRRTDLLEKRRSLMQEWANFCAPQPAAS